MLTDARLRLAARVLLVPYLVALALIVWLPGEDASRVTGIVATIAEWLSAGLGVSFDAAYTPLEFLANIALFVPFGLLLSASAPRLRWWGVTLAGCATSALIECLQILLPTRFPTLSDVIANTAGAAFGWALWRIAVTMTRRRRSTLES